MKSLTIREAAELVNQRQSIVMIGAMDLPHHHSALACLPSNTPRLSIQVRLSKAQEDSVILPAEPGEREFVAVFFRSHELSTDALIPVANAWSVRVTPRFVAPTLSLLELDPAPGWNAKAHAPPPYWPEATVLLEAEQGQANDGCPQCRLFASYGAIIGLLNEVAADIASEPPVPIQ